MHDRNIFETQNTNATTRNMPPSSVKQPKNSTCQPPFADSKVSGKKADVFKAGLISHDQRYSNEAAINMTEMDGPVTVCQPKVW